MGYGAWTEYAFRSALKQAEELGWTVAYNDPLNVIRADWKRAFNKGTWLDVPFVAVLTGTELEQHRAIAHRLNPSGLKIRNGQALHDLSVLQGLTRLITLEIHEATNLINVDGLKNCTTLQQIYFLDCTTLANVDGLKGLTALSNVTINSSHLLTNVDGLKNLTSLQDADFSDCTGLTNLDALKGLTALETLYLGGCTKLTKEHITALKATLPNTEIHSNYLPPADTP